MVSAWRVCHRWMKRMGSIPLYFLCLTISVFPSSLSILWKTEFDSAFLHALYSLFILHPFSCWPPLNLMPMSSISTVNELYCLAFLAKTCSPGWVPLFLSNNLFLIFGSVQKIWLPDVYTYFHWSSCIYGCVAVTSVWFWAKCSSYIVVWDRKEKGGIVHLRCLKSAQNYLGQNNPSVSSNYTKQLDMHLY